MPRGLDVFDEARLQRRLLTPAVFRPSLWLDGSELSTLSADENGINTWADKSGFDRNASTTVRKPTVLLNAANGLPAINFTASAATKLDTTDFSIATSRQFCAFAVVSAAGLLGGSTYRRIWVSKGVNPDSLLPGSTYPEGYFGSGANNGEFLQIAGGSGIVSPTVTGLGTSNPVLLAGAFGTAGASSNENLTSANGGARVSLTGQSGALGTTGLRIGSDVSTITTSSWDSWIGEIILTGPLSFADFQRVEGCLAWKWGLALHATHPFCNRPPLIGD